MTKSSPVFKMASRNSRLALIQTKEAILAFRFIMPRAAFEVVSCSSPGDRDKVADLSSSAPDFFTRDLHETVLNGTADCAIHSAKDLEYPLPPGIDWFWLTNHVDVRDALVLRKDETTDDLPTDARVGTSSQRREKYCRRFFPKMIPKSIRGNIEERVAKLDAGEYDMLIMAAAGLQRLGMINRIAKWITTDELPPPDGQGYLALTFRADDAVFLRLRSFFVKPVVFAGAGCGSAETCTFGALNALKRCDICFHDNLIDSSLLTFLPSHAERVDVGKRCGDPGMGQKEINTLLTIAARRGRRVVRLKGGDPGIFGRLAEEVESLDSLHLPYRVIPGVSSLNAATTGTGMLLTQRGVCRGFTVMTPRQQNGEIGSVQKATRDTFPMIFFMGTNVSDQIMEQLKADGLPETTPVAIVFEAGSVNEVVLKGAISDFAKRPPTNERPGIIIVGSPSTSGYHQEWGALMGLRVLLTCSETLQSKASDAVRDFGGIPIALPMISMVMNPKCLSVLKRMREFDRLVISSPSSVHMMMHFLQDADLDLRDLPEIIAAGSETADALKSYGVIAKMVPEYNFGTKGLIEAIKKNKKNLPGISILRLRSQLAGPLLANALSEAGYEVTDCVLYFNNPLHPEKTPSFDAVFFASTSAVEAFLACQRKETLAGKLVIAIGRPTLTTLKEYGIMIERLPHEATVQSAIETMAALVTEKELERLL